VPGASAEKYLPDFVGGTNSEATAVDDNGDVVGVASKATTAVPTLWPQRVAPASGTPPAPVNLQTVIPASADVTLEEPLLIADNGDIVATAKTTGGTNEDVELLPHKCGSGSAVTLTGVAYGAGDTHGARINRPLTLDGDGFCPGMSIEFGNDQAVVTPPDDAISTDRTSVTVTVPRLATTGTLSLDSAGTTASLPETFAIDSFRDTVGLQFHNLSGVDISLDTFEHVFGVAATTKVVNVKGQAVRVPTDTLLRFFFAHKESFGHGTCFGWVLAAQRLSDDGDTPLASLDPAAQVPWDVPLSPASSAFVEDNFILQWSPQVQQLMATRVSSTAGLLDAIKRALAGGVEQGTNGALISIFTFKGGKWAGHSLLAYDVQPQPDGGFLVDVADPNIPFLGIEDTSAVIHADNVAASTLKVTTDGDWFYTPQGWSGFVQDVNVIPFHNISAAIAGGLTITDQTA
jgi:hypothetical protein